MRLRLHVKRDEYQKYGQFQKFDDELDKHTTLYIDRQISSMINDLRRFADHIELYDNTGDNFTTISGYYAFQKALASHLAFKWYETVPHWALSLQDMQKASRTKLLQDRAQDLRRGKHRYNWTMPRYVAGLFEYPVPGMGTFPLNMSLEYSFCIFALENNIQFYADDQEYLEQTRDRLKTAIDWTLSNLEKHIVPRL